MWIFRCQFGFIVTRNMLLLVSFFFSSYLEKFPWKKMGKMCAKIPLTQATKVMLYVGFNAFYRFKRKFSKILRFYFAIAIFFNNHKKLRIHHQKAQHLMRSLLSCMEICIIETGLFIKKRLKCSVQRVSQNGNLKHIFTSNLLLWHPSIPLRGGHLDEGWKKLKLIHVYRKLGDEWWIKVFRTSFTNSPWGWILKKILFTLCKMML